MEDKKLLNNEELNRVSGGTAGMETGIIAACSCGGELTLDCRLRTNSDGKMEVKCPLCGKWKAV